ncbi:MAG TPA: hypothetical protein PL033_02655 [Candidatus Brocadiia bacterium]|nr:hypothetical protein [Candidatus Brocadiia bacterium]
MISQETADRIKAIRNEIDDYQQTVLALKATANEFMFDDEVGDLNREVKVRFGRRMKKSSDKIVTPDLVVTRSSGYGIVGEAKLALPDTKEYQVKEILQIKEYDDDLSGWDTVDGRIQSHDIIQLVHHLRGPTVRQLVEEMQQKGELILERNLAVVRFCTVAQRDTWLSLELCCGALQDKVKQAKLAKCLPIKYSLVAGNPHFASVKLYDACPPLPYLMVLIHETIVNELTQDKLLQLREEGRLWVELNVQDFRRKLSSFYGPGEEGEAVPEIPRANWIHNAMNQFVAMGWAKKHKDENDTYDYEVRKRRKLDEQFIRVYAKTMLRKETQKRRKGKPDNIRQRNLFE